MSFFLRRGFKFLKDWSEGFYMPVDVVLEEGVVLWIFDGKNVEWKDVVLGEIVQDGGEAGY